MYFLLECALIVLFAVGMGTGLFLAVAMAVVLKAGWEIAVTKSQPMTLRAGAQLREKLGLLHLIEIHNDGNCLNP